jgi:tRNA threonylcarbamoyladenosine biosynthesis protein TsaE
VLFICHYLAAFAINLKMNVEMNLRRQQTKNAEQTQQLAEELAATLQPGDLITLSGPLGAGKTTFVQGLARGLGCPSAVTSPTFVLMTEHQGRLPLSHVDAYRLENLCYDAIRDTGVLDAIETGEGVTIIEWPERIEEFLPRPRYAITLIPGEGESRTIEIVS